MVVLTLAGCGGGGSGSGKPNLTIGSKKDTDGQLLATMYSLLLQKNGYNVTLKLALGDTPILFQAIQSNQVSMYPEFTGTALSAILKLPATQDAQAAYNTVKQQYEQKYHITWLDPAYGLNDSYGICTSQSKAQSDGLSSLNDLTAHNGQLTIATPPDGLTAAVQPVEHGYNVTFKNVVQEDAELTYQSVQHGDADLNVCYTTDTSIVTDNFVVLKDTQNVFPIYNPAPIIRDDVLSQSPQIANILKPLESKLTTDIILQLIAKVQVQHETVHQVAKDWLTSVGLL
jgi:glycine betaine/choline ABC-type transport system substrate-binding protein